MSQLSNILNESNGMIRRQMEETKGLVSKWNKTGLLEGIDHEYEKHGAVILCHTCKEVRVIG